MRRGGTALLRIDSCGLTLFLTFQRWVNLIYLRWVYTTALVNITCIKLISQPPGSQFNMALLPFLGCVSLDMTTVISHNLNHKCATRQNCTVLPKIVPEFGLGPLLLFLWKNRSGSIFWPDNQYYFELYTYWKASSLPTSGWRPFWCSHLSSWSGGTRRLCKAGQECSKSPSSNPGLQLWPKKQSKRQIYVYIFKYQQGKQF